MGVPALTNSRVLSALSLREGLFQSELLSPRLRLASTQVQASTIQNTHSLFQLPQAGESEPQSEVKRSVLREDVTPLLLTLTPLKSTPPRRRWPAGPSVLARELILPRVTRFQDPTTIRFKSPRMV